MLSCSYCKLPAYAYIITIDEYLCEEHFSDREFQRLDDVETLRIKHAIEHNIILVRLKER